MIAVWVWIGAAVLALVAFGFCGYELVWKLGRLRRDVVRLQQVATDLGALQGELARTRAATTAVRVPARPARHPLPLGPAR